MKREKKVQYKEWLGIASSLQSRILNDEECINWWLNNVEKIYDTTIERPVLENLPLVEVHRRRETIVYADKDIIEKVLGVYTKDELPSVVEEYQKIEDIYKQVYYYNTVKDFETDFKVRLDAYCLKALKAKYIDNIKLSDYAIVNGYTKKYMWFLMNKVRREIKKYIREQLHDKN